MCLGSWGACFPSSCALAFGTHWLVSGVQCSFGGTRLSSVCILVRSFAGGCSWPCALVGNCSLLSLRLPLCLAVPFVLASRISSVVCGLCWLCFCFGCWSSGVYSAWSWCVSFRPLLVPRLRWPSSVPDRRRLLRLRAPALLFHGSCWSALLP
jgi:hypothetical protein